MNDDVMRFKWILLAGSLFLVSLFMSWQEMKYAMFGKTVEAQFLGTEVVQRSTRSHTYQVRMIEYSFMDGEKFRREAADVSMSWPIPTGPTIAVRYVPGSPDVSRLPAQGNSIWVAVFVASVAFGGFHVVRVWREAYT